MICPLIGRIVESSQKRAQVQRLVFALSSLQACTASLSSSVTCGIASAGSSALVW